MEPLENCIWGEVEDMLYKYRDGVSGVLLDNFEKSKALANEIIENAEAELKRCGEEKQRLIRQVQKGIFTDGEVKSAMSNIREREEHWQNELTNAQLLLHDSDAIWNAFMEKLEAVNRMYDWAGIWFLSDEQKKSVLNALVEEFILGPAGEIEIRYKLPVTEKQLQDTVASMLSIDKGRGPGGWIGITLRNRHYGNPTPRFLIFSHPPPSYHPRLIRK